MNYSEYESFIQNRMRMSHVYQSIGDQPGEVHFGPH